MPTFGLCHGPLSRPRAIFHVTHYLRNPLQESGLRSQESGSGNYLNINSRATCWPWSEHSLESFRNTGMTINAFGRLFTNFSASESSVRFHIRELTAFLKADLRFLQRDWECILRCHETTGAHGYRNLVVVSQELVWKSWVASDYPSKSCLDTACDDRHLQLICELHSSPSWSWWTYYIAHNF